MGNSATGSLYINYYRISNTRAFRDENLHSLSVLKRIGYKMAKNSDVMIAFVLSLLRNMMLFMGKVYDLVIRKN